METNKLGDYLLNETIRKQAMKNISQEYPLNDEMLNKYRKELDWEEVSGNDNISWTVAMIDRWENQFNWKVFSQTRNKTLLTAEIIEKFKDQWDWGELSGNQNLKLSFDLIDKYIDRWDWDRLINRCMTTKVICILGSFCTVTNSTFLLRISRILVCLMLLCWKRHQRYRKDSLMPNEGLSSLCLNSAQAFFFFAANFKTKHYEH